MRHAPIVFLSGVFAACGSATNQAAFSGPPVTFSSSTDYECPVEGNIATGDVDGDGQRDIVTGGRDGEACVLFNQGRGTFGAPVTIGVALNHSAGASSHVEVFDVNGDGMADIFFSGSPEVYVAFGRANRSFGQPVDLSAGASTANRFSLGDVDGDGTIDVCAPDPDAHDLAMIQYLKPGGHPSDRHVFYQGAFELDFVADMDGDKRADLIGSGSHTVEVALSGSGGAPTYATPYGVDDDGSGDGPGLLPADINGDGVVDVVAFSNRAHVAVLLGNGDGSLRPPIVSSVQPGDDFIDQATLGDLDGDGTADALVITTSNVLILHGQKDGSFSRWSSNLTLAMLAHDFQGLATLADVDGDGRADLVEGDMHTTRVFLR